MVRALLDTCFVVYEVQHNYASFLDFCKSNEVFFTSFNLAELEHIKLEKHLHQHVKKFLDEEPFTLLNLEVYPGHWEDERSYVEKIDKGLLAKVRDPSDAVLAAAAIVHRLNILTRDKHHLFTEVLEKELGLYGLKAYNTFDSLLKDS